MKNVRAKFGKRVCTGMRGVKESSSIYQSEKVSTGQSISRKVLAFQRDRSERLLNKIEVFFFVIFVLLKRSDMISLTRCVSNDSKMNNY